MDCQNKMGCFFSSSKDKIKRLERENQRLVELNTSLEDRCKKYAKSYELTKAALDKCKETNDLYKERIKKLETIEKLLGSCESG